MNHRSIVAAVILVISGFGGLKVSPQQSRLPLYQVARVTVPIKVDGRLDEQAWKDAALVGDFVNNRDGSRSKLTTEARVLYDDSFIYFSFRAVDKNIWATMK